MEILGITAIVVAIALAIASFLYTYFSFRKSLVIESGNNNIAGTKNFTDGIRFNSPNILETFMQDSTSAQTYVYTMDNTGAVDPKPVGTAQGTGNGILSLNFQMIGNQVSMTYSLNAGQFTTTGDSTQGVIGALGVIPQNYRPSVGFQDFIVDALVNGQDSPITLKITSAGDIFFCPQANNIQSGQYTLDMSGKSLVSGNTMDVLGPVTFPTSFSSIPNVVISMERPQNVNNPEWWDHVILSINRIFTDNFTFNLFFPLNSGYGPAIDNPVINWIAVGTSSNNFTKSSSNGYINVEPYNSTVSWIV